METQIGLLPPVGEGGIDIDGLDVTSETMEELLEVDVEGWSEQLPQMREHYARVRRQAARASCTTSSTRLEGRLRHT